MHRKPSSATNCLVDTTTRTAIILTSKMGVTTMATTNTKMNTTGMVRTARLAITTRTTSKDTLKALDRAPTKTRRHSVTLP